jgi:hypothetical protein
MRTAQPQPAPPRKKILLAALALANVAGAVLLGPALAALWGLG